jgi:hypothetical protein
MTIPHTDLLLIYRYKKNSLISLGNEAVFADSASDY